MYRVTVVTDGKEYPLLNKVLKLDTPTLQEVIGNSPNYLKLGILPTHPYYGKIDVLRSELFVYENGEELFRGRSVTGEESFNRTHKLTCESDIAYLCDSVMRPYEFQGSIIEFLDMVLDNHNSQVEERKRFQRGNVTVVDTNNYINRSDSNFSNSFDALRNKLVETHGGYLRTRVKNGVRYLDYVTDAGGINQQVIQYGVNLAGYQKNRDATSIITALIPTGADLEDGTTVDITSVNNGVDYIYDQDAVNTYGWIWGTQKWEDVTLPVNLLAKARAYLEKSIYLSDVLQLTAVDLADMGVEIDRLKTGYWTKVKSRPHGLDVTYLLEERVRYLQEPGKGSISLGGRVSTFSRSVASQQNELNNYIKQVAHSTSSEINRAVDNATQLITGGKGGYVILDIEDEDEERTLPWRILVMDSPDKAQAKNVIQINRNGIGFSTTGIGGPYRNAWTIDGRLVADFIATGTMYADRIKGGTLSLGGADNVNGVLKLYDTSGNVIGQWDKDGIIALNGTFAGALQGATGTFSGDLIAVGGTFSGDISGANGTFTGGIKTSSAEITGGLINIETSDSQENVVVLRFQEALTQLAPSYVKTQDGSGAAQMTGSYLNCPTIEGERLYATNYAQVNGSARIMENLDVLGTKNRVVQTKNYGDILHYCYEMAMPFFGDIGTGEIGSDGECLVYFDDMFRETIEETHEYMAFLQKEGEGDLWVTEKTPDGFTVRGTPGLAFSWEVKAQQIGQQYRLEKAADPPEKEINYEYVAESYMQSLYIDYEGLAWDEIEKEEREVLSRW